MRPLVSDINSMIKVKDPENLTAVHVQSLRGLVSGGDKSRSLQLEALDEKLR